MPGTIPDSTDSMVKKQSISHRNLLLDLGLEPRAPDSYSEALKQKAISIFQNRLSVEQGKCSLFQKVVNHIKHYKETYLELLNVYTHTYISKTM